MATLIRFPYETDAEFERRSRPMLVELGRICRESYGLDAILKGNKLYEHILVSQLRESCGVKTEGTFKWDVASEP